MKILPMRGIFLYFIKFNTFFAWFGDVQILGNFRNIFFFKEMKNIVGKHSISLTKMDKFELNTSIHEENCKLWQLS